MKVFVVERGCYSDRYVAAVFSTQELADADIAQNTADDGKRDGWNSEGVVSEFEVDEYAGHVKRRAFRVYVNLETGAILRKGDYDAVVDPHIRSDISEIKDFRSYEWSSDGLHQEITSYESFEHAEKVAAEARQAWLRSRP